MQNLKKNIVTIGSFDGVHLGHQSVLEHINRLAEAVNGYKIVVTFDPHPRKIVNGNHEIDLLTTTDEKIELLKHYGIDEVVVVPFTKEFSNLTPYEYLEEFIYKNLKTNYLVIGFDHKFGRNRTGDIDFLKSHAHQFNFNIEEIPANTIENIKISSTKIRNYMLNNEFENAIHLLGHPYNLTGKVILGNKLGRTIGFPTANLEMLETDKLIPSDGIYAATAIIDNKRYLGMLYIGNRPTIANGLSKTIELNLIDFEGDLYHQKLKIDIHYFIRNDIKFENLEQLKSQIYIDKCQIIDKLSQI